MNDTDQSQALAHIACSQVVLEFMARFDAGDAAAAAALFAPDGRWQRADGLLQGREALEQLIRARKPATVVRHVLTNLRTEVVAEDRAVVRAYVLLFKHETAGGAPAFPVPLDGVAGFGRYVDELRRTEDGWLIEAKSSVSEFKQP